MSTSTTKHNKPSIVVAAQNREEVLSFSIRNNNNNNNKRKIGNKDNNDDDTTGDNVHCDEIITQRQSPLLCWCTFHEFRLSTIQKHPSFIWLGPSSMAVYWFKEYLQTPINKQLVE